MGGEEVQEYGMHETEKREETEVKDRDFRRM